MTDNFETEFISEAIEKTPFSETPAQKFFAKWCKINDSITPEFITREEWEQRGVRGILEKNEGRGQTLFLPEDLHLWEMIDVIQTVDHDTLARKPELRGQRAGQIREVGQTFEKAGIYLNHYLPKEAEGEEIAQDIAQQFYSYGLSLQEKTKKAEEVPANKQLTEEDKQELDEWFLGTKAYRKRVEKLGENPTLEEVERLRVKMLQRYFKALAREGHKTGGEKPWETIKGPFQHLQDRTKRQVTKAIETPKREMKTAIFRRGLEKLVTEMKKVGWEKALWSLLAEGVGFDLAVEKTRLYNSLEIPKLKAELEEVRTTGDIAEVSAKELEIAKKILLAVNNFPYRGGANNPSEMVETQFVNCVGSSILGGGLLDEAGIRYLHVSLPEHSATVLVTSDGKVYWQDFTPPGYLRENYTEITADMIEGGSIPEFAKAPDDSGLTVTFKDWNPYIHFGGKLRITLFNPEIGLQCHILYNVGNALCDLERYEEAIEAYQQVTSTGLKYVYPYYGLGFALRALGRNEEAIEAYQQAISVDPKYAHSYNGLGNALDDLERYEEAIKAYRNFIKREGDQYWVERAERIIEEIEGK